MEKPAYRTKKEICLARAEMAAVNERQRGAKHRGRAKTEPKLEDFLVTN